MKPWTYRNQYNTPTVSERFWEKVDIRSESECWNWLAHTNHGGYGTFGIKHKSHLANRFAWELTNGKIPDGMCVCHKCDNPSCCNPAHLFLGTLEDNNHDRKAKGRGRGPTGEQHPRAKLKEWQVREIRELYRNTLHDIIKLAAIYGVSKSEIDYIVRGQTRKHI